jgi:hypothetical protein
MAGKKVKKNKTRDIPRPVSMPGDAVSIPDNETIPEPVAGPVATVEPAAKPGLDDFYELDPEGDVILTLPIPRENTTITTGTSECAVRLGEPTPEFIEPMPFEHAVPTASIDEYIPEVCDESATDEEFVHAGPSGEALMDVISIASEGDTYTDSTIPPVRESPSTDRCRTVNFRVSSSHLRLASPVFRGLLEQYNVRPGSGLKSPTPVPLQGDDPHSLLTFLNILHHNTRKVPGEISFEELVKMGALVQKYNCVEVVEGHSLMWWDEGEMVDKLPKVMNDTLLQYLYVARLFGIPETFHCASLVAVRESRGGDIEELVKDLMLPRSILSGFYSSLIDYFGK